MSSAIAYINAATARIDEAWASRVMLALEPTRGLVDTVVIALAANGGTMTAAESLYNLLVGWPAKIVTHAIGPIMSVGLTLFLAGQERFAAPVGAAFLFHGAGWNPTDHARRGVVLSEAAVEEVLIKLRACNAALAQRYRERCSFTESEIGDLLGNPVARELPWLINRGFLHGVRDLVIPADAGLASVEPSSREDLVKW